MRLGTSSPLMHNSAEEWAKNQTALGCRAVVFPLSSDDPEEKINEYNMTFMNPKIAARHGYVDEVIKPEATRERLYSDLILLEHKRSHDAVDKKHGNIPL